MSADFLQTLRTQAATSLFPVDGTLHVPGLGAPVTITRDPVGTPAIEAASLDDLWFAQGLVTAGERLFQLDLALRAANGRLSEVFGERMLEADRFTRTIGLHRAGAASLGAWTAQDHAMHARFREGVRAWIAAMPAAPVEYQLLGLEPDLSEGPGAWASCYAYLAWGLSNNYERELLRARIAERLGEAAMWRLVPPSAGGSARGSNNWVVSGERSASGKPLLANDPHLPALQPGVWLPLGLRAPGYDVRGVALTFGPGIIIGATPHHAWGVTNVTGDVQDLFIVSEADVTSTREETIEVRGEVPVIHRVRETPHGPILDRIPVGDTGTRYEDVPGTYALRWVGHDAGIRPSLALEAAQSTDFASFRSAVLQVVCPGQNFVYADVDGHIGLQVTGRHPIRRAGDGSVPLADHAWDGWVPDDALPTLFDPPEGVIVTANDGRSAAALTEHLLTTDFHASSRADRIAELLANRERHDAASFAAIQRDTVSLPARTTVPMLVAAVEGAAHTERQRDALAVLAAWNHDLAADSRAAAVYEVWAETIARRVLLPRLGEELFAATTASAESWKATVLPSLLRDPEGWLDADLLVSALQDALDELGDPVPSWGDLHRLVLAHPLAAIPGLEDLFVAANLPLSGDEQTVAQAGMDGVAGRTAAVIASWRVVWDLADLEGSRWTVPAGVSGNPASPHWRDQTPAYTTGRDEDLPAGEGYTLSVTPS